MMQLFILALLAFPYASALAGPPSYPKQDDSSGSQKQDHSGHQDDHKKVSICNTYTTSILGSNAPETQHLLMTLFVNTALVGNYTTPNTGVAVNGIMWPGEWKGQPVNLMPWFNGDLASSNPCEDDCGQGVSVNWLNSGGPDALRQNLTSYETGTNQFYFVTHLTQYFGYLLGCSDFGTSYLRYNGSTNMYHIHKYMCVSTLPFPLTLRPRLIDPQVLQQRPRTVYEPAIFPLRAFPRLLAETRA